MYASQLHNFSNVRYLAFFPVWNASSFGCEPNCAPLMSSSLLFGGLDLSILSDFVGGCLGVFILLFWLSCNFFDGQHSFILSRGLIVCICYSALCNLVWFFGLLWPTWGCNSLLSFMLLRYGFRQGLCLF